MGSAYRAIASFAKSEVFSTALRRSMEEPKTLIMLFQTLTYSATNRAKRPWIRSLFERFSQINCEVAYDLFTFCLRQVNISKSMDFQDLVVLYLQSKYLDSCYKTYLEIGAYDGINKSNCYLLMKNRWRGVCIEPNPITSQQCKANRKEAQVINAAFGDKSLGSYLRYYWPENRESNGTVIATHQIAQHSESHFVDIQVIGVNDIVKYYSEKTIGYVSIDTEGGEFEIAKTLLDSDEISIGVFSVEHNFDNEKSLALNKLFSAKGYTEIFHGLCRNDSIYVKNELFFMGKLISRRPN